MPFERPEIKIFVSRRIDVNSVVVNNPLYLPMRCGAVYDPDNPQHIMGDDTGDNISSKRNSLCEFTVQYWAWKNADADYFGLCHYRRYLSFSEKRYHTNDHGLVACPVLSHTAMKRFGLLDADQMAAEIEKFDLIVPQPASVARMPLPRGKARTVRELWEAYSGIFFEAGTVERMLQLIDALTPAYAQSAREYLDGRTQYVCNCYVMARTLFQRLCEFQFSIIEAVAKELDGSNYADGMQRVPAYVGEILFGIFVYHVRTKEQWRVAEKQLVLFEETRELTAGKAVVSWLRSMIDRIVRIMVKPLFPIGSQRRETMKKIYFKITRKN